jgi:hypothetical protein
MSYTFLNLCRHVLNIPQLDMDARSFKMQECIEDLSYVDTQFYTAFLSPLVYSWSGILSNIENPTKKMYQCASEKMRKLKYVHSHYNSWFSPVSQDSIDTHACVLNTVYKCQRHYHALLKFSQIIRHKYAKIKNTEDLLLMPIHENDKGTYPHVENGVKYIFRVGELRQIITTCIANTESFFPEKLDIKNPYSNILISDSVLYNFYFFMKTQNYNIPDLIHGFFLSGFNYNKYLSKYEILIRDFAIEEKIMRSSVDKVYPIVFRMMLQYRDIVSGIHISYGFPKDKLVEIMRPYLLLYYYTLYYASDFPRRYESEEELSDRLSHFARYNPCFGQRTVEKARPFDINSNEVVIKYNSGHPKFYSNEYKDRRSEWKCDCKTYIKLEETEDVLYRKITELQKRGIWNDQYSDEESDEDYVSNYYIRYTRLIGNSQSRLARGRSGQRTNQERIRVNVNANERPGISTLYDTGDEDEEEQIRELATTPFSPPRQTTYTRNRSPSYDSTEMTPLDSSGNIMLHLAPVDSITDNIEQSSDPGTPDISPPSYSAVDVSGEEHIIQINPDLQQHSVREVTRRFRNSASTSIDDSDTRQSIQNSFALPEIVEAISSEISQLGARTDTDRITPISVIPAVVETIRRQVSDLGLNESSYQNSVHDTLRELSSTGTEESHSQPFRSPSNVFNEGASMNRATTGRRRVRARFRNQSQPANIDMERVAQVTSNRLNTPVTENNGSSTPLQPNSDDEVEKDEYANLPDLIPIDNNITENDNQPVIAPSPESVIQSYEAEKDLDDAMDISESTNSPTSEYGSEYGSEDTTDTIESAKPYDPSRYAQEKDSCSEIQHSLECTESSDEKEEASNADRRDLTAEWIKEQEEVDEWYFGREDREYHGDSRLVVTNTYRENISSLNFRNETKTSMGQDSKSSGASSLLTFRGLDGNDRPVTITQIEPPRNTASTNTSENQLEFVQRFEDRLRERYLSMGFTEEQWIETQHESKTNWADSSDY